MVCKTKSGPSHMEKKYMFCGNHETANGTNIIYSLLCTCKINNVNPAEWFTDIFNRIQDCKMNDLHQLMPNNWKNDDARGVYFC